MRPAVFAPIVLLAACGQAPVNSQTAASTSATSPPAAPAVSDAAQVQRGQRLFLRCIACHEPGEPKVAKVGPHLKGIVGRPAAAVASFNYSKALAGAGFSWDEAKLLAWLERPTAVVPETTMVFEGMASESDRRAVVAYLRSLR